MLLARRFHGLTIQWNAPLDVQEIALSIQLHEQRHAGYCHAAADSLGGTGELNFDTARLDGGDGRDGGSAGRPSETAFWETVCGEFAVSETVAFGLLSFSIRSLPPSGYRRILKSILADEALHTRIGFLLLASLRKPGKHGAPAWIEPPDDTWIRDYVHPPLSPPFTGGACCKASRPGSGPSESVFDTRSTRKVCMAKRKKPYGSSSGGRPSVGWHSVAALPKGRPDPSQLRSDPLDRF